MKENPTQALAAHGELSRLSVKDFKVRIEEVRNFINECMTPDIDHGIIPGTKKATLWKSGAEKIDLFFGVRVHYEIIEKIVDFDRGLFDYEMRANMIRMVDGVQVGEGMGSCSSFESKYRWRQGMKRCPHCLAVGTIIKKKDFGRGNFTPGWLCYERKEGCGADFDLDDPEIVDQESGKIENPDPADVKNTILKMACKRAHVDGTIAMSRLSWWATQDLKESDEDGAAASDEADRAKNGNAGGGKNGGGNGGKRPAASELGRNKFFAVAREKKWGSEQMAALVIAEKASIDVDLATRAAEQKNYAVVFSSIAEDMIEPLVKFLNLGPEKYFEERKARSAAEPEKAGAR